MSSYASAIHEHLQTHARPTPSNRLSRFRTGRSASLPTLKHIAYIISSNRRKGEQNERPWQEPKSTVSSIAQSKIEYIKPLS